MRMFLNCVLALVAVVCLSGIAQAQQFCQGGQCYSGPPVFLYAPPPMPVYARPAYAPVYVVQDVPVITQEAAKPQTDTGGVIEEPTEPPPRPPRPRPDYHFSPQCAPMLVPGPPVYSHCMPTPYRVRRSFGVGLTFHWNSSRR